MGIAWGSMGAHGGGGPAAWPKTGAYSVDVETFERIALPTLVVDDSNMGHRAVVIDEIGRMELHSTGFKKAVEALLESPHKNLVVFGAITAPIYGHRVAFCDKVTSYKCVKTVRLKKSTRESVTEDYIAELKQLLVQKHSNHHASGANSMATGGKRKRGKVE